MLTEIKEKLKQALPEKRYIHSLGVADEAERLAIKYGADKDKAYLAGLLHDCAKGIPTSEQAAECARRGVEIDEWTRKCPPVIHGFLGAEIAKTEYGIMDEEVLNAIRYHTVGAADMTLLEKIIYIADMTETNRDFPGVEILRQKVNESIDGAIKESIRQQLKFNMNKNVTIHPNMICLWNSIVGDNKMERGQ